MYLIAATLIVSNALITYGNHYSKCCKFGESLTWTNSSYECVESNNKRLQIAANESNFVENNTDGDGVIVSKRPVTENYFPKCCPLSYTYDSVLHSCVNNPEVDYSYIKENFVKVGLPRCKIVVDYELNGTTDFEYGLINGTDELKLKRNSLQDPETFCIDKSEKGSFVIRECKGNFEVCEDVRCVKKCCPDGQSFINRAVCFDTYTHGVNLSSFDYVEKPEEPYAIIYNRSCSKIYMMKEDKYTFNLDDKGVFSLWQNDTRTFLKANVSDLKSYCIEHTKKKNVEGYFFFMCFPEKHINAKFAYTAWPKILSCVCLVLTVAVYLILNETRNVFGKILVNYCVALFFENAVLIYAQLSLDPSTADCKFRSFAIIFFATASFSWSNVMCCDIWWTFGSAKRTVGAHQRKRDLKKLLSYFLYGWGVPTVLTLVILFFYTYRILPYPIQPIMAVKKCFFERRAGNYAHALFFNLPHLVIQLVNTVLFIKTIVYCLKVKNEIDKINDTTKDDKNRRFQKDKERLFLILKLSVIMGVSFMFEVVSAFFDMSQMGDIPKYIEIVWDTINCSQGIFIFIIFICKRKIYRDFQLKFRHLHPRSLSTTSIHTQSTIASNGTSMKVLKSVTEIGRTKFN
ncbi:hypothetical protein NQ315_003419 [Exocentrus adspersus]|uniref:G-protein coupled receptors family 2 profile 2 domain-containing protein n=1 Tax=Exocentrus adspersus TaxID=1586481 RepID=A0AAV8VP96_9CUCU|nr:hypothetical protein NQ315_003419 [Exocentrus adspersus]